MAGDLTFDESKHAYAVDGAHLPSVTQIVTRLVPRAFKADAWYLRRGSMVHRAIALLLRGQLDWESLDPRIIGFVRAAEKATLENLGANLSVLAMTEMEIERRDYHRNLRFAGTLDLFYAGHLWDWKCSNEPQTEIQLGGYVALMEQRRHGIVKKCAAVELHADGTYCMSHYKPARCKALFMAALTTFGWMEANKSTRSEDET